MTGHVRGVSKQRINSTKRDHGMVYDNITKARFISRPNRFIAEVEIDGRMEIVHVKNTGRCKELLIPGCEVWLTAPGALDRKTKYDLVVVRKDNGRLFNIDSQAPNKVAKEWLALQDYDIVIPEYDNNVAVYFTDNFNGHNTAVNVTQKIIDNGYNVEIYTLLSSEN